MQFQTMYNVQSSLSYTIDGVACETGSPTGDSRGSDIWLQLWAFCGLHGSTRYPGCLSINS